MSAGGGNGAGDVAVQVAETQNTLSRTSCTRLCQINPMVKFPLLLFAFSFVILGLSVLIGDRLRKLRPLEEGQRDDFGIIQGATLTLLGLLVGFTFSMAVSRYDQRKNYEEAEANAIGTEYVRADLLPAADAEKVRELLKRYLEQRILFYTVHGAQELRQIDTTTGRLENELWSVVQARAAAQPTPIVALAVLGMNDVLNSQGYTQAAWWNHIPVSAWALLAVIGVGCNLLVGYGAHRTSMRLFMILPLAVSISFFLIADIDSPRGGMIRIQPENLASLSQTLHPR